MDLFEDAFNHHSFTGRSGTFFAYEGLGSIYWHMVSKLALAVLENYCDLKDTSSPEQATELLQWFREIRDGLGVDKNPAHYGAFPTDAYSHTPAHAGAQQPGMTGQVKEDVLIRIAELGVFLDHGRIRFRTDIIEEKEFLENPISVPFKTVTGEGISIDLAPGSLAFSFCQVPVIYKKGSEKSGVTVHLSDGSQKNLEERLIPEELSREIFMRTGQVSRIDVNLV